MKCQVCGALGCAEGEVCSYCGAVVRSVLGRGQPLPSEVAREFEEAKQQRETGQAAVRKARLKRHALAGTLIFCGLGVLVFLAQTFLVWAAAARGTASAERPAVALLVSFVLIPVYGAAIGAPMGFLVSKWRLGFYTSGAAGALIFFASYFLLGMRFMLGPIQTPIAILVLPVFGFVFGAAVSVGVRIDSEN